MNDRRDKRRSPLFQIQHQIYESHPDLKPAYLDEPLRNPEENRALGEAMLKAGGFADTGKITEAIIVLEAFISS